MSGVPVMTTAARPTPAGVIVAHPVHDVGTRDADTLLGSVLYRRSSVPSRVRALWMPCSRTTSASC
jgi:hypothetical protein